MWSKDTLAFLLVGLGMIVAALVVALRTAQWIMRTQIASGTVVRTELSVDDEGGKAWYPVVEYATVAGAKVQFRSSVGSGSTAWKPGDAVQVRYDPADPQNAAIDRWFYLFLVPLVLVFIGVIFAGIAICLHYRGVQR